MRKYLLVILILFLILGCSLDYEQAMMADELSETLPETVLIEFTHSIIKNGNPVFIISADKAATYPESKKTIMEGIIFKQFNSSNELISEGRADRATMFSATENIELENNVYFYSITEESAIEADYLYWNNEEGTLTAEEEDTVSIRQDSGTRIQGTGFYAELYEKDIHFRGFATGTWVDDEE